MFMSPDRLAEIFERSAKRGILGEGLDRALLDKDQNSRVEILVARGLQIVRKLACATHPRQIQAANKMFAAEMNELCKAKPDTEGSQQAKATFLHFAQCSAYVISLSRCPAFQRTAWRSLLDLHEHDIWRWEVGIASIHCYPTWWTKIETSDDPSVCATSCAHCVSASDISSPSERSTTSASRPAISNHSTQHSETVGAPAQSTTIPPRMRGSNPAQPPLTLAVDPDSGMSKPPAEAEKGQTARVQAPLEQSTEPSHVTEKGSTQEKGGETDKSGGLERKASLLTASSADMGQDESRVERQNRTDKLPASAQLGLKQAHDATQGAARESRSHGDTHVSLQQFNDAMRVLLVRLDSQYRATEARRTAQTVDIMTQMFRLSQQISRLESASGSQAMER